MGRYKITASCPSTAPALGEPSRWGCAYIVSTGDGPPPKMIQPRHPPSVRIWDLATGFLDQSSTIKVNYGRAFRFRISYALHVLVFEAHPTSSMSLNRL
jgi:hypothetical protein